MGEKPDDYEITVFRSFVAKLISLQKQRDESYNGDRYIRDRLLTAVDMPLIRDSLRDRVPSTSQKLISSVANRLSASQNSR